MVSTATLALQDQLWRKDLPHLKDHAGVKFSTALLKGRSNYVCLAKLHAADGGDALFDERPTASFERDLERLILFATESETGDVADIDDTVAASSWRMVTCGPNECPGATRCDDGDDCFAELSRIRAEGVDLVVVNHALYCAHLATGGRLLPEHDVVVFDEAHALDRIATTALGVEITAPGIRHLAARLRRAEVEARLTDALQDAATALEGALLEEDGRVHPGHGRLAATLDALAERIAAAGQAAAREDGDAIAAQAARLATSRLEAVRRVREPNDSDVVWIDGGEQRRTLRLAPIEVGPRLAPVLFEHLPAILVSATLGPGERFEPLARRLGLDPSAPGGSPADAEDSDESADDVDADGDDPDSGDRDRLSTGYVALHVEPSFDYREQAMLYVPDSIPEPARPEVGGGRRRRAVRPRRGRGWADAGPVHLVARRARLLRRAARAHRPHGARPGRRGAAAADRTLRRRPLVVSRRDACVLDGPRRAGPRVRARRHRPDPVLPSGRAARAGAPRGSGGRGR